MQTNRLALAVALALGLLAACSGVRRPEAFLLPGNQLTWEEGERLIREGERDISEGERKIEEGRDLRQRADRLVDEGREQRKQGEALAHRGRQALRAARMLEEAEELRRTGTELRDQAIPAE